MLEKRKKLKILYLWKILKYETDKNNKLSTKDIIEKLLLEGIKVDRNTVYEDIKELEFNNIIKIHSKKEGKNKFYWCEENEFSLSEIKIIIDIIQTSKFLTDIKKNELINKLLKLVNTSDSKSLKKNIYFTSYDNHENENIYLNTDIIHKAIVEKKELVFKYYKWNLENKKLEPRNNGKIYNVIPLGVVWNDGNYYLVGNYKETSETRHYRIDKINDIEILGSVSFEYFEELSIDMNRYADKNFGMYKSDMEKVTLYLKKENIDILIDRFGKNIKVHRVSKDYCEVNVNVAVSSHFFGWLTSLRGEVKIKSPEYVVKKMKNHLLDVMNSYN